MTDSQKTNESNELEKNSSKEHSQNFVEESEKNTTNSTKVESELIPGKPTSKSGDTEDFELENSDNEVPEEKEVPEESEIPEEIEKQTDTEVGPINSDYRGRSPCPASRHLAGVVAAYENRPLHGAAER